MGEGLTDALTHLTHSLRTPAKEMEWGSYRRVRQMRQVRQCVSASDPAPAPPFKSYAAQPGRKIPSRLIDPAPAGHPATSGREE
jgi:hypothetical protein